MSKFILSFCSVITLCSLLFTGCKDEIESETTIIAKINGEVIDRVALSINSIMYYEFEINSTNKLSKIELYKKVSGVETKIYVAGSITNQSPKIAGSIDITSDMQLTLVTIDKNGNSSSKAIVASIFLTTAAVTDITFTSAKAGGKVAEGVDGITAKGICWDTKTAPSIDTSPKTSDGTGNGIFSSAMSNLIPATTYYIRAYALGKEGVIYGNEFTFSTLIPPVPAIPEGGFETPALASGYKMNPTPSAWTFVGGGAGIQKNGSAFGAVTAPEGTQTALFQGGGTEVNQTFTFTEGYFAISMKAAQRGTQKQNFEIYIDNVLVGKVTPSTSAWEYYASNTFSATAGPHKLAIKGMNSLGGDNSGFIDDVKLEYRNKP